jgi:hypothetical protein
MGKIASAIVAVTLVTSPLVLPVPASAENGQIAAGVVGGLIGGALLGGALAARPAPPPPVIMRRSRSTSKSRHARLFTNATGMDMAGSSAESRFATDQQSTYEKIE